VFSNLVVSTGAGFLSFGWTSFQQVDHSLIYAFIAFCSTLAIYNYQRLYKASTIDGTSHWLEWVRKHRTFLMILTLLSGLTGSILLILILSCTFSIVLFLLGMIIVAVLYVVPIRGFVLRELPGLKAILVTVVWTGFIIAFPLMNEHQPIQLHWRELTAFFCYFLALTIPFDVRDLKYDKPQQRTIPQLAGTLGSKVVSILLLVVFVLIIAKINNEMRDNVVFYTGLLTSVLLIIYSKPNRPEWYFALIDASMIVVGVSFLTN